MGVAGAEDDLVEIPVHSLERASGAPAAEGIQVTFEVTVPQGGDVTPSIAAFLVARGMAVGWACERACDFQAPEAKIRSRAARRLSVTMLKM